MKYRREIDGLRAVAVIPVILFHAGFAWTPGGFVGVDVFFVISGYLITTIILSELNAGTFTIAGFYERRARRILPALFFVVACCLPFAFALLLPDQLDDFARSLISVLFFYSNFYFRSQTNYFAPSAEQQPLLHTWSLAVEEQFYVLFPLLAMLCWRKGRKAFVVILTAFAIASFVYADVIAIGKPDKLFFDTRGRVWELLIGSLIAVYLVKRPHYQPSRLLAEIGSALGLLLIVYACISFERATPFPGRYALFPTIGAACIILYAGPGTLVGRLLSHPLPVGIGLISYSAYLWHQPLFAFARVRSETTPDFSSLVGLGLLSLVLAYLSWRYIEQPFRRRNFFTRAKIFKSALAGAATFALLSVWVLGEGGLPKRFSPEDADLIASHEDRATYVRAYHTELQKMSADQDGGGPLALVVGDSFSQDFVNVIKEGRLLEGYRIRARYIPARCQIYRGDDDVSIFIAERDRKICDRDYYAGLEEQLAQADVLILAASWKEWSAERLPQTIQNLRVPETTRVIVVGRKSFGIINRAAYVRLTREQKSAVRSEVSEIHLRINETMRSKLQNVEFIDLHSLICGRDSVHCPVFTENGELLSYDGTHLTRAGAHFLADQLRTHSFLQPIRQQSTHVGRDARL